MSYLTRDCPYCKTKQVSFFSVADYKTKNEPHRNGSEFWHYYTAFFVCNHCGQGISVWTRIKSYHDVKTPHHYQSDLEFSSEYKVIGSFPAEFSTDIPADLPNNIKSYFKQGVDAMKQKSWDAAGVMFRKVVDVTTKEKKATKGNLKDRIDTLAEEMKITPDLAKWAHEIRDLGNDASHEEEPFTQEQAEDIYSFCDLFMRYVYTLPRKLESRRKKKEAEEETE